MQSKHNRFALDRYTMGALIVVILLAATLAAVIAVRMSADAAPMSPKPKQSTASQFSFSGASGWSQGPSNKTSMALFHGTDCFTAIEYKSGTVDPTTGVQNIQAQLAKDGYTYTPLPTQTVTIQTNTGQQAYDLYTGSVSAPTGATELKGGQAIGYLPLAKGHLEIEGYCDTAEQLPALITGLQAYRFDGTQ